MFKSKVLFTLFVSALTSCNFIHESRRERMQGLWIIDEEESIMKRKNNVVDVGIDIENLFSIGKDSVNLPSVYTGKIYIDTTMSEAAKTELIRKHNREREYNCRGHFYFPDTNADYVVFEAPNNPLVGKYKIQIFDDGQYRYMILSNDSTYLVCSQNTFYLW
ncbi:MAG: hypothetical protein J6Y72_12335 [Bacteroidales bacterium]|nr:hypothetical protein [Bacteroidales bacterium]